MFHIFENKASILFFFNYYSLTNRKGLLNAFLHKSSKKASTLSQMQVPTPAPVAPADHLLIICRWSHRKPLFSGTPTDWLLRNALALWLNPGS